MRKLVVLLVIGVLAASNLVTVGFVFAQSVPKPLVPDFTLKLVSHPYDVPPTYEMDPYTGEEVLTAESYHVENKSVEITIKNQPYSYSVNGSSAWLVYQVVVKGHYEETGITLYWFDKYTGGNLPRQSSFEHTVISVPADDYPMGGEVDFQVQAISIYETQLTVYPLTISSAGAYDVLGYAIGEFGDWSDFQTVTFEASQIPSPEPFPTTLAIASVIVATVVLVGLSLLLYGIKRK